MGRLISQPAVKVTAWLSGAETARQEKCDPRERGTKFEQRAARLQRGRSAVVVFAHFFFFLYSIFTCIERGASAVENVGSPRHWDRQ